MDNDEERLYNAILSLNNAKDCESFFKELCTPKEIKDMKERFHVASLLMKGNLSYREIQNKTKVSLTTITRVARFLTQEPYQGYKLVLGKQNENNKKSNTRL